MISSFFLGHTVNEVPRFAKAEQPPAATYGWTKIVREVSSLRA